MENPHDQNGDAERSRHNTREFEETVKRLLKTPPKPKKGGIKKAAAAAKSQKA